MPSTRISSPGARRPSPDRSVERAREIGLQQRRCHQSGGLVGRQIGEARDVEEVAA